MRRAVVALRQRRALAGLALAGRRAAAGDAAVERAGLELLLDEADRGADAFLHGPGHLRLRGDREEAANVLEKGAIGLGEIVRVGREPLHRLLALLEHGTPGLELNCRLRIRIDQVFDRAIDRSRILIHTGLKLHELGFHLRGHRSLFCPVSRPKVGVRRDCRQRVYGQPGAVTKSFTIVGIV